MKLLLETGSRRDNELTPMKARGSEVQTPPLGAAAGR